MANILEVVNSLSETIDKNTQRSRQLNDYDVSTLLGTAFATEIQNATTMSDLTKAMLKANKISMAVGMPRLAGMINNLGQIKQAELAGIKNEQMELQKANSMKQLVGSQVVADDEGNFVKADTLPAFKEIEKLLPEMRYEAYSNFQKQYATDIKRSVDFTDKNKPILNVYGIRKSTGEVHLKNKYQAQSNGFYDDLLTNDIVEQIPEPQEIIDVKNEMIMHKELTRYEPDRGSLQVFQDQEGNQQLGWVFKPSKAHPGGIIIEPGTGRDITQEIKGKFYVSQANNELKNSELNAAYKSMRAAAGDVVKELKSKGNIDVEFLQSLAVNGYTDPEDVIMNLRNDETGKSWWNPADDWLPGSNKLKDLAKKNPRLKELIENYDRRKELLEGLRIKLEKQSKEKLTPGTTDSTKTNSTKTKYNLDASRDY